MVGEVAGLSAVLRICRSWTAGERWSS